MTSLARQLAEHPRWRWEPGMAIGDSDEPWLYAGADYHYPHGVTFHLSDTHPLEPGDLPDTEHPATRGWLLAMLREAYPGEEDHTHTCQDNTGFWVCEVGPRMYAGDTEGEALARALLAAWGES